MDARRRRQLVVVVALVVVAASAGTATLLLLRASGAPPLEAAPPAPATASPEAAGAERKSALRQEAAPAAAPKALAKDAAPPIIVERFGARRASCAGICDLEATCGLRSFADCTSESCEGELRKLSSADFVLARVADCAEAAATPCDEACWKRGECAGDHDGDRQCAAACRTMVQQLPKETYRESRCVIERSCAELPLCAERG